MKCRLHGEREENVYVIRKCIKLAQHGYKSRHEMPGNVIHRVKIQIRQC